MIEEYDELEEVPHADVALRDLLQADRCVGRLWERTARVLAEYGWSVMSAWLSSGLIASKCSEKGRDVDLPQNWNAQDREDLVAESVAQGIEMFRRALLDDRWKPERGASLRTYFLGGCVLAFPNVLRRWHGESRRYHRATLASTREMMVSRSAMDPVDTVDALDELRDLTRNDNRRNQAMHFLIYHGYAPVEIAGILGMKPSAVNTALSRLRKRRGPGHDERGR